jgi:hypothetical protein
VDGSPVRWTCGPDWTHGSGRPHGIHGTDWTPRIGHLHGSHRTSGPDWIDRRRRTHGASRSGRSPRHCRRDGTAGAPGTSRPSGRPRAPRPSQRTHGTARHGGPARGGRGRGSARTPWSHWTPRRAGCAGHARICPQHGGHRSNGSHRSSRNGVQYGRNRDNGPLGSDGSNGSHRSSRNGDQYGRNRDNGPLGSDRQHWDDWNNGSHRSSQWTSGPRRIHRSPRGGRGDGTSRAAGTDGSPGGPRTCGQSDRGSRVGILAHPDALLLQYPLLYHDSELRHPHVSIDDDNESGRGVLAAQECNHVLPLHRTSRSAGTHESPDHSPVGRCDPRGLSRQSEYSVAFLGGHRHNAR